MAKGKLHMNKFLVVKKFTGILTSPQFPEGKTLTFEAGSDMFGIVKGDTLTINKCTITGVKGNLHRE